MTADPHAVQVSVDGSCYPNQGRRSGYAGIVVYPDDPSPREVLFQGFEQSTIQRMELAACIAAIEWIREEQVGRRHSRVQIFSDSRYVVDGQRSAPFWQKLRWRTSAGRPIDNWDLWKEFLSARSKAKVRVDILKVQNKSTPLLKLVDKLAKAAAQCPTRVDRGLVVGKIGRAKIKGTATLFNANGQLLVIRIVGSKAVGPSRENRFVFEVFDENTSAYTSKHFAYCNPETGAQLHRQRGFRVRMNDVENYPQIIEVIEEVPLPKQQQKSRRSKVIISPDQRHSHERL